MKKSSTRCLVFLKRITGTQFFKIMRVTVFLLLIGISNVFAGATYSQNTKFSFNMINITLEQLFEEVQKQSEFNIFYKDSQVDLKMKINVAVNNASVEKVLELALKEKQLDYKVFDRQIVIFPAQTLSIDNIEIEEISTNQIQQQTVSGKVTDTDGISLPGVSVIVKGTTIGTVTNHDGEFSLIVPQDAEALQFSFVGMRTQELNIGDQTVFNITMEEATIGLEEVVAVGYGVQKKESVIAAISQTDGENIKKSVQGADLANALKGQLPGLVTLQNTGIPGGSFENGWADTAERTKILIRGRSTWNEASPLILVDGVERDMFDINPYEIEKISILKDASATAVFGVKGANGVILITTIRGKEGKSVLTFDASITAKTVSKVDHVLGSYETNVMRNHALINEVAVSPIAWGNIKPQEYLMYFRDKTYPEYLPDVDWMDEIIKNWAFDKNFTLTASGGTPFLKYFTSFSYMTESDIFKSGKDFGVENSPHYGFDRFNFRSNLDFDITRSTRFVVNLSGYYSETESMGANLAWFTVVHGGQPPDLYPMRYSDGTFAFYSGYDRYENPAKEIVHGWNLFIKRNSIRTDFQLNQKLDFITDGLSVKGKFSYDNESGSRGPEIRHDVPPFKWIDYNIVQDIFPGMTDEEIKELEDQYTFWDSQSQSNYDYFPSPSSFFPERALTSVYRQLYYELSLFYSNSFRNHRVSGLALMSRNERARGSGFTSYREDWVGRLTYDFDSRYFIEFNGAYNGSEKFSRDYRFGFFPSAALGWLISNEPFFTGAKSIINNLKIRYSNGKVGSDASIPRWLYVGGWNPSNKTWKFGGEYPQPGYPVTFEGVIPNPDIHWEVSHKSNLGIESGFFENQLTLNFDYFWENRTDIFLTSGNRNMPDYFGGLPVAANLGEVFIKGWEFESKYSKYLASLDLNLWAGLNWAYVIDKIIEREDPELAPAYQKQKGFPIGQSRFQVNQPEGLIQNWNDMYTGVVTENNNYYIPGDFHIIDYNSDGIINRDDNIPYGFAGRPQYNYSPSLGFKFKNLRGSIMLYGVYNLGGEGLPRAFFESVYSTPNSIHRETWSPERGVTTDAKYAGLRVISSATRGSMFIPRAYLKIQTVELAYNIPNEMLNIGFSDVTLKVSGNNLHTWTKARTDQDVNYSGNLTYPILRRVNFAMSFNF